jgi:hypothetical protein
LGEKNRVDFAKGISKNQAPQKIQTLQSIPHVAKYNGDLTMPSSRNHDSAIEC